MKTEIKKELGSFVESLLFKNLKTQHKIKEILKRNFCSSFKQSTKQDCDNVTEEEVNNKLTSSNYGLIKEFYKSFWDELKEAFVDSLN